MKYQVLKRLKTTSKLIGFFDTMEEAVKLLSEKGARFVEFSYYGGFPIYQDEKHTYSIQGQVHGMVCSLPKEDLALAH